MKSVCWILLCVSLLNIQTVGALLDLEEGDICTITSGTKGICTNIQKCPYALDLLRLKKTPIICAFEGHAPIVCCPKIKSPSTDILQKATATMKPLQGSHNISQGKCWEFYPYLYQPVYTVLVPGGKPAVVDEFKHMALIGFGEADDIRWQCGGSLVSLQFVMTAAHCLLSPEFGVPKWVLLGDLDISTNTDGTEPQQIRIKNIIPHPEYKRPSRNHDIALLKLEKPATRTKHVAPACLDTSREHDEAQMIATGWGRTEFAGEFSNHLLKIDLDVVSVDQCRDFFKDIDQSELQNGIEDDLHICAGGGPLQDTCQGDSGGPLQIIDKNRVNVKVYIIVGVTSFGKACGLSNSPGVYTRVYSHLTWLEQNIWPSG